MNYLENVILNLYRIIEVYIYFIKRGNAKNKVNNIKTIAIIHSGKLGDMVCTTPLFIAINKKFPNSKIILCGNKVNKELMENETYINQYIVIDKKNPKDLINNLKKHNIDIGILITPDFLGAYSLFMSNAKYITVPKIYNGFSPYETISYKIIRKLLNTVPHSMGEYAPRQYMNFLTDLIVINENEINTKKVLSQPKPISKDKIDQLFIENNIKKDNFNIVISSSVANKIKKWPNEKWAMLIDKIYDKYKSNIILIGIKNDIQDINHVKSLLKPSTKVYDFCGLLSLDELKALILISDLFISVDTGPIYIAEAFGIPTIDIIGPMDENEQPPRSNRNMLVIPKREKPAIHIMNARQYDKVEALRQINSIEVSDVYIQFEKLIESGIIKP
jgi:ADP-heptose:LPS heptosyltransferase